MISRAIHTAVLVFGITGFSVALLTAPASAKIKMTETKTLRPGISYTMPAGQHVDPNALPGPRVIAPRIPGGAAALQAIKLGAGGQQAATGGAVAQLPAAGPSPKVVLTNCQTNSAGGFAPSDIIGAVGTSRFVVTTNVLVNVYNKSGCSLVSGQSLTTFFSSAGVSGTATLFDPQVIYDRNNGRFFVTAESKDSANTDQYQYFAISKNSTATSWWIYRITLSQGTTRFCKVATNSFWDYPHAGHANGSATGTRRWFITANDFPAAGGTLGKLLVINKTPTLSGGATTVTCWINLPFNLAPPIVLDRSNLVTFISPGSGSGSTIARRNLTLSSSGTSSDTFAVPANVNITAWTAPPNATQPGTTATLDSLDGRFQAASIQSRGLLWNVHAVNVSGFSKARVYKINQSASATPLMTFTPSLIFPGNAAHHLFNPSLATGSGAFNAPLFINVSSTVPSITSGNTGKPSMQVLQGLNSSTNASLDWYYQTIANSAAVCTSDPVCRWGDYSATQVDPSGSGRAWAWNQLMTGTSQFSWTTRATQVELLLSNAPTAAND